ncbi:MAG: type 2 isopentenyl-diphosphate Delta-isomerase [Rhodobacterales bacterium]|nr:MAG: type 2 isopentenyl-diphosphate Delta-isomerase [Rhodobacterales bacterium]
MTGPRLHNTKADQIIASRKLDHLRSIQDDAGTERHASGFDALQLTHRALPELDFDAVDTRTRFLGKELSFPLLISSMTGGTGPEVARINENLARAAQASGVAMAVGSQRVMFRQPEARQSFELRNIAPDIPLISNIGAVQLRAGFGAQECLQSVEVLGADGLYLHLNPLQEVVQPEGDRDFSNLAALIADLVPQMPVPVLLKEVGAGLSPADIQLGLAAGIRHFDVAGRGGTSWSRIEYHRRTDPSDDLGLLFQDWGLTTVQALRLARPLLDKAGQNTTLIASGGLRSGIDMAKAIILGADICGMAAPFLAAARQSADDVIAVIERIKREFQTALFLLGCADCAALQGNDALLLRAE